VTGAASRRKGHDFEREFCRWVRDEFGIEFGRNLKQYGTAQEGDTDPLGGYLPECKNCARLNLKAWWGQAVEQAKKRNLRPLLVYKIARKGWRAVVPDEAAWATEAAWRYDYEYTKEVSPALLALIVREHLG
jgi:hypothetical protein